METILPVKNIKTLWITLSNRCNHRCAFCYQTDFEAILSKIVFKNIEPIYPTISNCLLQGGEVTVLGMTRPFCDEILSVNKSVKFDIVTNGHEFGEEWQSFFIEHGRAVHFSINASKDYTYQKITRGGNWERLLSNIWSMVELKKESGLSEPIIRASMVVTDDNVEEIYEFARMCEFMGLDACNITYDCAHFPKNAERVIAEATKLQDVKIVHPSWPSALLSRARGIPTRRERQMHNNEFICQNAFESLMVDIDGRARFCCLMDTRIGDLSINTIEEVWNSEEAQRIRRCFTENKYREAGCVVERCMAFN
jgi:MoaA/NifB/PqqE/SkfB family radical SAM enzyme